MPNSAYAYSNQYKEVCLSTAEKFSFVLITFRRDYISLLNANTLSLDGMASLNAAMREIVFTDNWNSQQHVHWLFDALNEVMTKIQQILNTQKNTVSFQEQVSLALIGKKTTDATETTHLSQRLMVCSKFCAIVLFF